MYLILIFISIGRTSHNLEVSHTTNKKSKRLANIFFKSDSVDIDGHRFSKCLRNRVSSLSKIVGNISIKEIDVICFLKQ